VCFSSLLHFVAAMSTFDEQVAKAQRLLQELDHSMALYDSTHGDHSSNLSHSLSFSLADQTDDRSQTNGNGGSASGQVTLSPEQAPTIQAALGAETPTQSDSPLAAQRNEQDQEQDQEPEAEGAASAAAAKLSKSDPSAVNPDGASTQDGGPKLVMAGEDLDDLM
jgi:hypothetical protein